MNNTGKLIIIFVLTFCCGLAGYFGTRAIVKVLGDKKQDKENAFPVNAGSGSGGGTVTISGVASGASDNPVGIKEMEPKGQAPAIVEVTKPQWNGKTYSFDVTAMGDSLVYCLADEKKDDVGMANETGHFEVRATLTGVYYVYVKDPDGRESDFYIVEGCTIPSVQKISAQELQRVLTSEEGTQAATKAGFKNRVAPGCSYRFIGINEDEEAPESYNDIINRLKMGVWASVEVQGVNYDSAGRMRETIIRVIY